MILLRNTNLIISLLFVKLEASHFSYDEDLTSLMWHSMPSMIWTLPDSPTSLYHILPFIFLSVTYLLTRMFAQIFPSVCNDLFPLISLFPWVTHSSFRSQLSFDFLKEIFPYSPHQTESVLSILCFYRSL